MTWITDKRRRRGARLRRLVVALATAIVCCVAAALTTQVASAAGGIAAFDGAVNADASGTAYTQAGGHPYDVSTDIDFTSFTDETGVMVPVEDVKTVKVDLPPGLVGAPGALPICEPSDFFAGEFGSGTECPIETQVGLAYIKLYGGSGAVPLYSLRPGSDDIPAAFGFEFANVRIVLEARVRSSSDYGITITVPNINQGLQMTGTRVVIWGVPAAREHDIQRCKLLIDLGSGSGCFGLFPPNDPQSVNVAPRAFMTLPTVCTPAGAGLETRLSADFWDAPGVFSHSSFTSHLPPGYPLPRDQWGAQQGPENCQNVPFKPTVDVAPVSRRAGSPTGLDVTIDVPQEGLTAPRGIATGHLKRASVTLPEGMSISPSAADGLKACADAEVGFGADADPGCREPTKVGTVQIDTPVIDNPLVGSVFIGEPKPGNIFRLVLHARAPGVVIKLRGVVRPDPVTGRITATFDDNPQLPFTRLRLRLRGGSRATLVNPPACGTYTSTAELTSWNGVTATSSSSYVVSRDGAGAPCPPRTFTPDFSAGLTDPDAGTSSTFTINVTRDDEDPTLRDITVDMPEGLTGKIADATLCEEAQAAAGTCGEQSRIGSTTTGAGAGTTPFYLPGRVYVTGPYKGAPFGLSIVVPAIAGPFDLGTVVVRAAIHVDRTTAKLRIVSDPLPSILEGVPLLIRTVNVTVDKPGFMIAPTNCAAKSVAGVIGAFGGAVANVASRFQVGSCAALPFRPRMSLRVGKRGRTHTDITTPFSATLRMTPGQANNRSVKVTLPKPLNSRLRIVNQACTLEAYRADNCGARARIGQAVAVTPLLRDPLRGSAYFVRNPARRLPDIMVALKGEVEFDLTGKISIPRDLTLTTNFDLVPDVPITMFRLDLVAGRNGPIGVVQNLCSPRTRRALVARLALRAQSGRLVERHQRIRVAGCARGAARGRRAGTPRSARRGGRARSRR